jgi:hypothetical protein
MKTSSLLFALVASAGFPVGRVYTAQGASSSQPAIHSSTTAGNGAVDVPPARPVGRLAPHNKSSHTQIPVSAVHLEQSNGPDHRQPPPANSAALPKIGSPPSAAGRVQRLAPHGATRSYVPSLSARHRSSNPAVIGEPVSARNKNTGVLDGTRMNRKP